MKIQTCQQPGDPLGPSREEWFSDKEPRRPTRDANPLSCHRPTLQQTTVSASLTDYEISCITIAEIYAKSLCEIHEIQIKK